MQIAIRLKNSRGSAEALPEARSECEGKCNRHAHRAPCALVEARKALPGAGFRATGDFGTAQFDARIDRCGRDLRDNRRACAESASLTSSGPPPQRHRNAPNGRGSRPTPATANRPISTQYPTIELKFSYHNSNT